MRITLIGTALAMLFVVSCGKSNNSTSCSTSPLLGTWQDGGGTFGATDQITFNANCTASEQVCGEAFTFSNSSGTNGSVSVNISSVGSQAANTSKCPSVGNYTYTYNISTDQYNGGTYLTWTNNQSQVSQSLSK